MKKLRKNYTHIAIVGVATMSLGLCAGFFLGQRSQKQVTAAASNSQEIQEARQKLQLMRLQFTEESRFVKDAKEKLAMLEERQKPN